jgi:signal transduction histidine kinase
MFAAFPQAFSVRDMKSAWLHRWVYYLAVGFMYIAVLLRSVVVFQKSPLLSGILILLLAWLITLVGSGRFALKHLRASASLIGLELLITLLLFILTFSIQSDFFALLFAITSMQVMQQFPSRVAAIVIGLSALLTFINLLLPYGVLQALALTLVYTALSIFLAAYIGTTRRAWMIQERQVALTMELLEANRKLDDYSQKVQQLATGRERQRLARELHDSVTQTIFSMTLVTQSMRILWDRDRQQVAAQLDRLDDLAHGVLSEMQELITQLGSEARSGSFIASLQQHIADRQRLDNLTVSLEVDGNQQLSPSEEASLFRITQEALNNVVKHAQTTSAAVRLHLAEPFWMEVEDRGAGFDPEQPRVDGRVGLIGMFERATEIGWTIETDSTTGQGTCIRVSKGAKGI